MFLLGIVGCNFSLLVACISLQIVLGFLFIIYLYARRFIDIKKGYPSTQGVYRGQIHKLQESRKSKMEENDWFCKADNQSKKVINKYNLRSGMDLSESSKHLLFLSLQRHHIK